MAPCGARRHCAYAEGGDLVSMIAERISLETCGEIVRWIGDQDDRHPARPRDSQRKKMPKTWKLFCRRSSK
jgi:hypothetical protein